MKHVKDSLMEFTEIHNEFHREWNEAMRTGDTSTLDRMTEDYYVAFFQPGNEKPLFFTKEESISGMKQSVMHFLGATKRFDNRVIRLRDEENAVVFYEQLVVKDDQVLARLFTIENWQRINGKWMIVREMEEPI